MDLVFHFSSILIVYSSRLAMAILSTVCIILVTVWCWRLFSNHKQLDHVPGPYLAGFSDFWRAWLQSRGELRSKLVELHKQYGPVVRYGVRSVSINDPSALDIVYGSRAGFVIVCRGTTYLEDPSGEKLITIPGGRIQSHRWCLPR